LFIVEQNRIVDLESRDSGKSRYGSWDIVGGNERHDGNHSKTSVVKLSVLLGNKGVFVNSGEVNWGEYNGGKVSSLGVVGSLGLSGDFSNKDGEKNLGLSSIRYGVPGIEGFHGRKGFEGNIRGKLSREVDSRSLYNVSGGGKHSNTAVLKFGGTEPSKGLVRSYGSKVKRIEGSNGSSASWHVRKGIKGAGFGGLHGGSKSGGRAEKSGKSSGNLHFLSRFK